MLEVRDLVCGYSERSFYLQEINFSVNRGELMGIIGPNGSGKSTLLKTIGGLLKYNQGQIFLANKEIAEYSYQQLAQKIAVVSQQGQIPCSGITVNEYILLGRLPYRQRLQLWETKQDIAIAKRSMQATDIVHLANCDVSQLSGGEWQRTTIARALCQEPELLLLDEPTTHLDIGHQKEILDLVKKLNQQGITVIIVVHDLNLASIYCDRLILLAAGKVHSLGTPKRILTKEIIDEVYSTPVVVTQSPIDNKPLVFISGGN